MTRAGGKRATAPAAAGATEELRVQWPDSGIAVLTFDRPAQLNALTDASVAALARALDALAADTALRALVITGAGRAFCAGFDLALAADAPLARELGSEAAAWTARQEAFAGIVTRLRSLRAPVIAAVDGPASGAGLGIALACEIRLASPAATFNAAFVKVGMSSCDIGVSWLLPRCIGSSRAFEIMLSGRMVAADEAERIGLVSAVVPQADLLSGAIETARRIAAHDAFAVWMTKRGGWANLEAASLQAAIELENRTQILARSTGALQRAAEQFVSRKGSRAGSRG
ncbi:MAG: enoyl-CoA hydratase-related protein [Burkholderiaceae bacterium]